MRRRAHFKYTGDADQDYAEEVLTALVVGILAIAGTIGIHELRATPQELGAPCVVIVPREWGEFKGLSKSGLVFEDKAGTLRLLDQMPCSMPGTANLPQVSVEVRRK